MESEDKPIVSIAPQPITGSETGLEAPKKSRRKKLVILLITLLVVLLAGVGWVFASWYSQQLEAVDKSSQDKVSVNIVAGLNPSDIGKLLTEKGVIRSSFAFDVYTRLTDTRDQLKAGTYKISPASSTQQIVDMLVSGKVDEFTITFLPGATVADARTVFIDARFDATEVDEALSKQYDHPLFATKPANADLEGYIYGETHTFPVGTTVEGVLTVVFDEFYTFIQENSLVAAYQEHGLSLFEGITLASIIQREVDTAIDQKQAAQVFYTRLSQDMPLGSDATFIYAAKIMGIAPTVDLDSPYNTRLHGGLTPGPIAVPSRTALLAVADPADTDYVYFINGDDGTNYFARTLAEHEANIVNHCQVKCGAL